MRLPSAEYAALLACGIDSSDGTPPAAGTTYSLVLDPVNAVRGDVKSTPDPSGVNSCTISRPGCHVSRVGAPPSTGIRYTSTLPSYCALNAIVRPSGENAGL